MIDIWIIVILLLFNVYLLVDLIYTKEKLKRLEEKESWMMFVNYMKDNR